MNTVQLLGRLTKTPELNTNVNGNNFCRFTVAVNRPISKEDKEAGKQDADFISCVAWGKTAETICEYFNKGSQIALEGRIQTGSFEKENGDKVYTTDILVNRIHFVESKRDTRPEPEEPANLGKETIQDNDPFADFGDSVTIDDDFLD